MIRKLDDNGADLTCVFDESRVGDRMLRTAGQRYMPRPPGK